MLGKVKPGDLGRGKVIQGGMRPDEIEEEDEHADKVVCGSKGSEALFGFVPGFELLVEALDEIVGYVVLETFDANMLNALEKRFNREFIGGIPIGNYRVWLSMFSCLVQDGEGLRGIAIG